MNDIKTNLTDTLVTVLKAHERAKSTYVPADNPFAGKDLKGMTSAGLLKSADKHPALNMAPKGGVGYDMEVARNQALSDDKADKSAKRMAAAKARAQRKVEFDKIADSDVRPDADRMQAAWLVVMPLMPMIVQIAKGKARWASRFLGSTMDDVPSMALEKMALMLAKSDKDLALLQVAANELGEVTERTGQIPGDQTEDERKERKAIAKARKWLMGVVNNRVMGALVDAYTNERNLRWDNIDIIATVMASISGVGEDPMVNRHKADRAPAFLGTKYQTPGGIDQALLAAAISAAITDRGLDPMVEFLLNDEHRRIDGAVQWSEYAEEIFMRTPDGDGAWMWDAVVRATSGVRRDGSTWQMDRARKARGDAARAHVRSLFEWMPRVIVGTVEAFDHHAIGWSVQSGMPVYEATGETVSKVETIKVNLGAGVIPGPNPNFTETVGQPVGDEVIEEVDMVWTYREAQLKRASRMASVMASDFELFYLPDAPPVRQMLTPVLRYASVTEAAEVLLRELAHLTTGNDLVASAVNA